MQSSALIGRGALAALAIAFAPTAGAQSRDTTAAPGSATPELVVSGTRTATPVDRLPTSVSVVTRAEIDRNAWQTLPEALRALPGLNAVSSGGPGGNTSLFLRGTNSDHALVLLDGQPVNDPSLTGGAFNFGDDILAGVDRVEVVRGPASTLYGSSAIGGVVNLVTAAGGKTPADGRIDVGIGTDHTYRAGATLRGTVDRIDYGLMAEGYATEGDSTTPRRLSRDREADGFDNVSASAKGVVRLEGGSLEGLVRWRRAGIDLDNVPNEDPNSTARSSNLTWQAAGTVDLLGDRLASKLAVGQSRYERRFVNGADAASSTRSDDRFDGTRTTVDWQNTLTIPSTGPIRETVAVAGVTWTGEDVALATQSVSSFGPFTQAVDTDAAAVAGFAQLQARLGDRIDVLAGVRRDSPEDYGDRTTWRAGAVLALPEISGRLRASGGSAFKAPTLYDRFGVNNFGYRGNRNLRPETSTGWEVGGDVDVSGGTDQPAAHLSVTWFRNDVSNLIAFQFLPDFTSTVVNVGKADIEGVEAGARVHLATGIEGRVDWTWTDARDATTRQRLLRRPEHKVGIGGRLEPVDGLTLSPQAVFIGRRLDATYSDTGSFLGNRPSSGYWQVDLAAVWVLTPRVSVYAKANNLLDRTIEDPNGFARPDRGVLVGARVGL